MPGLVPRLYDDARYVELGMLVLVLIQLLRPPVADALAAAWQRQSSMTKCLLVVLVFGGLASTAMSRAPKLGLLEVSLAVQLMFLFGIVACAVRDARILTEALLIVSLFSGAALCVLKFWAVYGSYALEGKLFSWVSPFLEFANVRFFSQVQAYTLFPVVIPLLVPETQKRWRPLVLFIAANFWALQCMVGTRAVWAGLIVALVTVPVFLRKKRFSWLRWHITAVALGVVIYAIFTYLNSFYPDSALDPTSNTVVRPDHRSIDERVALAHAAIDTIREHPLLGIGPGQFGLQAYDANPAHPHSVPLQLLSEYGLLAGTAGLLLVAFIVVFALRNLRSRSMTTPDPVGATLVAALLMGLTDSLFSGNLIMPQSQVLFVVIAGWIVGRGLPSQPSVNIKKASYRVTRTSLVCIGILATGVTIIFALEYLFLVREIPLRLLRWNPHFWQYGHFYIW